VSGGPPRKVFHLTPTERTAFQRWLEELVRRIRLVRQDFLLKLYFAQRLDPESTAG
jgi:DNA-binding PadR family transcriptional regulator